MASKSIEWWSSWSDFLAIAALVLGAIVDLIAVVGWIFSWKAGKLKDEAFDRFQRESEQAISEANFKAAEANKFAATANESAARLEKEAAQAKLELAQLQSRIAPRSISIKQSRIFSDKLQNAQKAGINIWFNSNDNEAFEFATQLHTLLLNAGYDASKPNGLLTLGKGTMQRGVTVVGDTKVMPILADPLLKAFKEIGIEATTRVVEAEPDKYQFSIEVGSKPLNNSEVQIKE